MQLTTGRVANMVHDDVQLELGSDCEGEVVNANTLRARHGRRGRLKCGMVDAILTNNVAEVRRMVDNDPSILEERDAVGAAPVHLAFLLQQDDIGKDLVSRYPHCTTLVYGPGVYFGENILHIAIIRQEVSLVHWLLDTNLGLLNAETKGDFFAPSGDAYFGGYPLLFAVASNQWDLLRKIVDTRNVERPPECPPLMNSIFLVDQYGNRSYNVASCE